MESEHVSFVQSGLVFLLCLRDGLWRLFGNVPELLERLPPGTKTGRISWQSSFHIGHRVAAQEVVGDVAIAGDAAHIHSPVAERFRKAVVLDFMQLYTAGGWNWGPYWNGQTKPAVRIPLELDDTFMTTIVRVKKKALKCKRGGSAAC